MIYDDVFIICCYFYTLELAEINEISIVIFDCQFVCRMLPVTHTLVAHLCVQVVMRIVKLNILNDDDKSRRCVCVSVMI